MSNNFQKTDFKDYFFVIVIGFLFGLLAIPILKNLNFSYFDLNFINSFLMVGFFIIFSPLSLWIASIIAIKIPAVFQFAKFGATGALNTFLDLGILNLLIYLTAFNTGWPYRSFKAISFLVANINGYLWNKYWVFKSREKNITQEYKRFFIISFIGLLINVGVASLITDFIAPYLIGNLSEVVSANLGAFLAVGASLIWNFIGYKFLVFK